MSMLTLADAAAAAGNGQSYLVAAMVSAVVAMAGALKVFWGIFQKQFEKTEAKLVDCEKGHKATNATLLGITSEVAELRGRIQERNEVADRLTALHAEVLSIVRSASGSVQDAGSGSGSAVRDGDHGSDDLSGDSRLPDLAT